MTQEVDLIVLGGGSAGLAAAQKAAAYGASVVLVEKALLGGTCVNAGCVPKKMTWYASQLAADVHYAKDYGFSYDQLHLDFGKFVEKRRAYIKTLNELYKKQLQQAKVLLLYGEATFEDTHTMLVNNKSYAAKNIIIATGCGPVDLQIKGAEFSIDSDGFFALNTLPKTIAIIGGGYIATEFACMLKQLGATVKMILRGDKVLTRFDSMISDSLMDAMRAQGIEVFNNHRLREISKNKNLTLHFEGAEDITNIDTVITAIGRLPYLQKINLAAASVKTDAKGFIITDHHDATNIPHIYAIGDVTGKKMLTPVAVASGRKLAERLFGEKKNSYMDYENIPTVVFTHPPIGSVGLSEEEAHQKYGPDKLHIYRAQFTPLFFALTEKKVMTHMKLVTLKDTGKIIGCHLIGLNVDEMMQGVAIAVKMGTTKKDFENTVAIHPTSAEELVIMR